MASEQVNHLSIVNVVNTQAMEKGKDNKGARKSLTYYMRSLHRDIGFLVIGLTLVYRQSGFLKSDVVETRTLSAGLSADDVGKVLHFKKIKVSGDDGRTILFSSDPTVYDGKYDRETGSVTFTEVRLPAVLNKLNQLHNTSSSGTVHWFVVLYGALLAFLALSAFWMFKPSTRQFRRGLALAAAGFVGAAVLVAVV